MLPRMPEAKKVSLHQFQPGAEIVWRLYRVQRRFRAEKASDSVWNTMTHVEPPLVFLFPEPETKQQISESRGIIRDSQMSWTSSADQLLGRFSTSNLCPSLVFPKR